MPEVPETPWARARATSRRARRSEMQGAKLEGGQRVPMSGAGRQKGDIRTGMFLIDDKYTDAESFTITRKMLDKVNAEAMGEHRLFQLRITMPGYKLRVINEDDYLYLQALAARDAHTD